MAQSMNHYMADLYPNMGFADTTYQTIAEPEDQVAMVDSQEVAVAGNVTVNPVQAKSIWLSVGAVLAVIIVLNIKF